MLVIQKVCPPESSLNGIETNIMCTEEGCGNLFKTKSNLHMHLMKHHKKQDLVAAPKTTQFQYHCPKQECIYNVKNGKCFTLMRYLKQHFLKVHAVKAHVCGKCDQKFSTKASKNSHEQYCGVKFYCLDCLTAYNAYEALITHVKRKNHHCNEKVSYIPTPAFRTVSITPIYPVKQASTDIAILPKPTPNTIIIRPETTIKGTGLSLCEIGIQTDLLPEKTKVKKRTPRKRTSQQTQTACAPNKKSPKNIQTQTTGDYILKRAMADAQIPLATSKRLKMQNIHTQTSSMNNMTALDDNSNLAQIISTTAKNDPFLIADNVTEMTNKPTNKSNINTNPKSSYSLSGDLTDLWNDSSTQTCATTSHNDADFGLYMSPQQLNCSSQTSLNTDYFDDDCFIQNYRRDGLISNNESKLCSIETQTELDSLLTDNNSTFERMLYSNTYTQTCDQILLDLGFNDIQTQTAWPNYNADLFVSAETQTHGTESSHIEAETLESLSSLHLPSQLT